MSSSRKRAGRLFQTRGSVTAKLLSPNCCVCVERHTMCRWKSVAAVDGWCSNKTVPCSPSQGNSCIINDWDTWFYFAYVVAFELPEPQYPVDYCVWSVLQERVYRTKVDNAVDLKQHIVDEWTALNHSVIASAIAQWHLRLHACVCAAGGHFEHCLQWHYPLFM